MQLENITGLEFGLTYNPSRSLCFKEYNNDGNGECNHTIGNQNDKFEENRANDAIEELFESDGTL